MSNSLCTMSRIDKSVGIYSLISIKYTYMDSMSLTNGIWNNDGPMDFIRPPTYFAEAEVGFPMDL